MPKLNEIEIFLTSAVVGVHVPKMTFKLIVVISTTR